MSELTPKEHAEVAHKLVKEVKDLLNTYLVKIGVAEIKNLDEEVILNEDSIGVKEIIEVVNSMIDKKLYPLGLITRSRKRELVMKRQIVAYICRSLGYTTQHIAKGMFMDHATVIHGSGVVKSLLKTNDREMKRAYNEVVTPLNAYHKDKYGKDLPDTIKGGNKS